MAGSKVHKALTDLNIRQLKYDPDKGGKYQYHADGGGLTIKVTSNNSKLWQLSYRLNGKQYHISLGAYPSVSLAQARAKREQIKALLAQGIDPRENTSKPAILFEEILNKWFEHVKDNIRESSNYSYSLLAKNYILPTLGKKPIDTITKKDLADLCENAKSNGKTIPGYLACLLKMIFNYAEDTGNIEINPASSLTRLFKQVKAEKGFAAQTEINDIRENLQKIQSYCNNSNIYLAPQVKLILQILPFVGLRNMALRQLKWENIDLETGQVNIDAIEGNKTKVGYSIYLGSKTLQLIKDYKKLGLDNEYIFPAIVKKNVLISFKNHIIQYSSLLNFRIIHS